MRFSILSLLLCLTGVACNNAGAGAPQPAASATARAAATTASSAPAATGANAEVATKDLTPAAIKTNAAKLLGKAIEGSGLLYEATSQKLNGTMQHSAYIADDESKSNSFKCDLADATKIPKNTKVKFEGKWMGGWLQDCKLTKL